jgi:hypothetical protein
MNYYFLKIQSINETYTDSISPYTKFAWVEKLGHSIIDYIEIKIGGEIIDKHYGKWMNIWNELTMPIEMKKTYDKMIGNVAELKTYDRNAKPSYTLNIPLNFWFCRKNGLAFPLIALQYSKFYINVKLKNIEDCAYIEPLPTVDHTGKYMDFSKNALQLTDIWENSNNNLSGNLLVDFVYLESQERSRFAKAAHEYLIEIVETQDSLSLTDISQQIELNFTGPSKEIIMVCQKNAYIDNYNSNLNCCWFDYSTIKSTNINPITTAQFILGNYNRLSDFEADSAHKYLNIVIPYSRHTNIPFNGINVYSFGLFPEEHQPSGTCNFTKITYPLLDITLNPDIYQYSTIDINPNLSIGENQVLSTDINIHIYSVKYQVLRIINGMAAFAFT